MTCSDTLTSTAARGETPPPANRLPFDDSASKALELAAQEAVHLGHHYIGTEHILLGLLRGEGSAARILAQHQVNLIQASWRVQELLDKYQFGRRHTS